MNLTQQELAEKTNLSRGNLSNYEKNKFNPSSDTIISLSEFFNVSTDWLLTGKNSSVNTLNNYTYIKSSLTDFELSLIKSMRQLPHVELAKIDELIKIRISNIKNCI